MRKPFVRIALLALVAAPPLALNAQAPTASGEAATLTRALKDHDWTLQSAGDAAGKAVETLLVPGHPFVLRFDGTRLGIQGGCNRMSGTWRLSPPNTLTSGRMAATQMACDPPLMAADAAMSALLAQPLRARVEPGETPTLRLVSPEGQTLAFAGRRTSTSLYGAPTRIFLEVAAQRVACTPAMQPATTCLQVRERRFDDKGLPAGKPGPWQAFYGEIAGYTHEPGVSNVLRIDRYKRPHPPAGGSAYIYELDLVVESRTAK